MTKITSAGRLHKELVRINGAISETESMFNALPKVLGAGGMSWLSGALAYNKLIALVDNDLSYVTPERREKYARSITLLANLTNPYVFQMRGDAFKANYFTHIAFEHVEFLDEILISLNLYLDLSSEKFNTLTEELTNLQVFISEGYATEIDDFIVDKLQELIIIINNYNLYGADGAEECVSRIIGTVLARGQNILDGERLLATLKTVLDGLVYTQTGIQALEWAGKIIALPAS